MSRRRKRQHEEEPENHERWLVSYADFITLLFAFFVVMYSVSKVDNKKLSEVAASVRWAMHMAGNGGVTRLNLVDGPPSEGGTIIGMAGARPATPDQRKVVEAIRRRLENRVRAFVMERAGAVAISVDVEDRKLKVRLAAGDFFDPGEAALRPQALPVLDAIADEIVPLHQPITAEGHTDDQPVTGGRFHDNWELSAARAATVASFLVHAHHAPPGLLTASGFAATRPLSREDTPEGRKTNRRVELVVKLDLPELEGRRAAVAPEPPATADPAAAVPAATEPATAAAETADPEPAESAPRSLPAP